MNFFREPTKKEQNYDFGEDVEVITLTPEMLKVLLKGKKLVSSENINNSAIFIKLSRKKNSKD